MIDLFNIRNHKIDTTKFSNLLHDSVVTEFEDEFAEYVGAKYACSANSASSLIYLSLKGRRDVIKLPSIIPPVVPNMVVATGNYIDFIDDIEWIGHKYQLVGGMWDSAQEVTRNQYKNTVFGGSDVMIFSFYPTKPVGSCDGGMIVTNSKRKIDWYRSMTMNGTGVKSASWEREQLRAGYKFHSNSIQMSIAQSNLRRLDHKNSVLDDIRQTYNEAFNLSNTSRHLYRIRVGDNRKFVKNMMSVGITCGIHYKCCHKYPFYNCDDSYRLPFSEKEETQTVSIPFHEMLTSLDIQKVIDYARQFGNL